MEVVPLDVSNYHAEVAIAIVVCVILLVRWQRSRSKSIRSFLIPNPPKDTVILHQYGRASTVPSISPFVMKLETFLRVAKIPYINNFSRRPGPKGKLPWIQYNDKVIPDSQICIQFLNAEKKVNLNKSLTPNQAAIGHLVRITVEESLYWTLVMWRLVFEKTGLVYRKLGLPSIIIWYMRRAAKSGLWSHGIGRYTQEEVTQIMGDDLTAISQILGENQFLFGNSVITEADCAMFGQLCQLVWQMPGTPVEENIAKKYANLVKYCERMKTAFWPDWDDRILHPSKTSEVHHIPNVADEKRVSSKISPVVDKILEATEKVDEPSRQQKSFTSDTIFFGTDSNVKMLSTDLSKSVILAYRASQLHSNEASRSRVVSASSIIANKATILSAQ